MNPTLKNILVVVAGLVVGSIVNMGLITIGPMIIAPPEGADTTTMEGLTASMHLFQPRHFLFPFLAHALGTLAGAFLAAKLAASRPLTLALIVGGFFLAGGITNVLMLPSPTWFTLLDLIVAYLPMAWLGHGLTGKKAATES